jgi:hypothetical protein
MAATNNYYIVSGSNYRFQTPNLLITITIIYRTENHKGFTKKYRGILGVNYPFATKCAIAAPTTQQLHPAPPADAKIFK